ncbi:MAG: UDP-N-acetylmuramoyl-L-alanyl-D-glutamate--2,6-diaminopimelate ligase, partial [Candidatus Hydrogenedentes bacterium]|nr:UDP-N-acetylmuramoyl-L-alanyl-D-glutamate--2,6-diaminopimelate ligase [Candidatus Hydrogenedentota bacterium]
MSSSNPRTTSDRWMLSALLARAGIGAEGACPAADVTIKSLTDDSRAVTPGACFVAVAGQACDGHRFVESAVQNGAVAVVVERDVSVPAGTPVVRVDDTRVALAKLAAAFYGLFPAEASGLRLIGITGTNGKTTVAWLLRSILQAAGHRIAMMGTIEYDLAGERCDARLTTPGALELCRHLSSAQEAGADYGVLEVSSHALDQRRTDGLTFTAGVFTNLSGDHLDYHETMPAYLAAKRRLFERLPADAIAVISADDPCGDKIARASSAPVITFGLDSPRADVTARIQEMNLRQSVFSMQGHGL